MRQLKCTLWTFTILLFLFFFPSLSFFISLFLCLSFVFSYYVQLSVRLLGSTGGRYLNEATAYRTDLLPKPRHFIVMSCLTTMAVD
jgi:hypothetical protein